MKIYFWFIPALLALCFIAGCNVYVSPNTTKSQESQARIPSVGNFNTAMKNLADQLDSNATTTSHEKTYIITSFSNLDKLDGTSSLGRLIAENLMNGLQLHKWQLLEVRLTKGIDVNVDGEFALSRDVTKLKDEYKISGIVTGTYSLADGNLTINARVIDVDTGILISSAQSYIPSELLPDVLPPDRNNGNSMKIVNDGIK